MKLGVHVQAAEPVDFVSLGVGQLSALSWARPSACSRLWASFFDQGFIHPGRHHIQPDQPGGGNQL